VFDAEPLIETGFVPRIRKVSAIDRHPWVFIGDFTTISMKNMVSDKDEANPTGSDGIVLQAQPVLDCFYEAVVACGKMAPFKPTIQIATSPGPIRYDHTERAVVLVPYELLSPAAKAGMDRFAAIGTLGLSGRGQYEEIFHRLLVAHELGHWLQMIALRPLSRWQAEYGANQMMVAFWREHPAPAPAASTETRLANFIAQPAHFASLVPEGVDLPVEEYFDRAIGEIELNPPRYAAFQKLMVRRAIAEHPAPRFCELVNSTWPSAAVQP
jgi:hypothetical protein